MIPARPIASADPLGTDGPHEGRRGLRMARLTRLCKAKLGNVPRGNAVFLPQRSRTHVLSSSNGISEVPGGSIVFKIESQGEKLRMMSDVLCAVRGHKFRQLPPAKESVGSAQHSSRVLPKHPNEQATVAFSTQRPSAVKKRSDGLTGYVAVG